MSIAHLAVDICMGFVCVVWFIQFLADHTRKRTKLPPPSKSAMLRRQAE